MTLKTAQEALDYARKIGKERSKALVKEHGPLFGSAGIRVPEAEPLLATNVLTATVYACAILKDRFELGEDIISKNGQHSYHYATLCLKSRFHKGEPIIAKSAFAIPYFKRFKNEFEEGGFKEAEIILSQNPKNVLLYAQTSGKRFIIGEHVLTAHVKSHPEDIKLLIDYYRITKHRNPLHEVLISKYPSMALEYSFLTGKRFHIAEEEISKVPSLALMYAKNVIGARFKKAEKYIAQNPSIAVHYAKDVLKRRFIMAEDAIMNSPEASYLYAYLVIKGRFIEGERTISKNAIHAVLYAINVLRGRFELGENKILKDQEQTLLYRRFLKDTGTDFKLVSMCPTCGNVNLFYVEACHIHTNVMCAKCKTEFDLEDKRATTRKVKVGDKAMKRFILASESDTQCIVCRCKMTGSICEEVDSVWHKELEKKKYDIAEEDRPTTMLADGTKRWYKNDVFHRDFGPAMIEKLPWRTDCDHKYEYWIDGKWMKTCYRKDGKLSRIDGPALMTCDGFEQWFLDGKCHREGDKPAVIKSKKINGKLVVIQEEWWENNLRHRLSLPAVQYYNGYKEWWEYGVYLDAYKPEQQIAIS